MSTKQSMRSTARVRRLRPLHLLWLLLLMFVLVPAIESNVLRDSLLEEQRNPLIKHAMQLAVIGLLVAAAVTVAQSHRPWSVVAALIGPTIVLDITEYAVASESLSQQIEIVRDLYIGLALVYVVWRGLRHFFLRDVVDTDTIASAVCAYLLLGLAFMWIYRAAEGLDPTAFGRDAKSDGGLFYFSFVTLTTLGYGDITPKTPTLQAMAIVQAIMGQMFVAVVLARLVALYGIKRTDGKAAE